MFFVLYQVQNSELVTVRLQQDVSLALIKILCLCVYMRLCGPPSRSQADQFYPPQLQSSFGRRWLQHHTCIHCRSEKLNAAHVPGSLQVRPSFSTFSARRWCNEVEQYNCGSLVLLQLLQHLFLHFIDILPYMPHWDYKMFYYFNKDISIKSCIHVCLICTMNDAQHF